MRLPREVSTSREGREGRCGDVTKRTSAPCAIILRCSYGNGWSQSVLHVSSPVLGVWKMNAIYLRTCARRRAPRARASDRARGPPRRHNTGCRLFDRHHRKQALGRVANLGDRYWVDVRLEYPTKRAVHNFERAQRGCAAQRSRCRWKATASNSSADHSASAAATAALVGSHCRMSSRPCLWLCCRGM